ncbi:MAG: outer membrane protein assembly factor BamB family protein [Planctomycetota bacterium]|jgi:outer membrane protein assembly factor BamB
MNKSLYTVAVTVVLSVSAVACAGDWPQFRGPNRDGKSTETGLLKEWPKGGPKLLWSYEGLGAGFSTVIVVDGTVYTNGVVGKNPHGTLFAFDLAGNLKWKKDYGPEWHRRTPGSHTPPTYDSGRLYHMSGECIMSCLDAGTGDIIWSIDTAKKFEGENLKWGLAEAPLVDGDKVICTPGGWDATVVALDKISGRKIWRTKGLSELSAYCSPVLVEWAGRRLVLTMVAKSVVFVDIETGEVVFRILHTARYDISAVAPIFKNGMLYVTNGYGYGGIMYEIAPDFSGYTKKWTDKKLDCHHGGVIFLDGHIYGAGSKEWVCLELATGKVKWHAKGVGKGSVTYADGMLYCYGEKKGTLALVEATPAGYKERGSFDIPMGTAQHWAHPVISNGRLYIRHGNALMAYYIRARQK